MTDKELLQLIATKVLRYKVITWQHGKFVCQIPGDESTFHWNPLENGGDALRLAVHLNLKIECMVKQTCARTFDSRFAGCVDHSNVQVYPKRDFNTDKFAATCRAIVLTAAEIAKSC